jgi:hypothetical protein
MSISNIETIKEILSMIQFGPIDSTTEKYLNKMAKYAAKIQEHVCSGDGESEGESKSDDGESKSDDGESKSDDGECEDEEIIYGDSDDDTAICAIASSNIIEGKRVRKPVQKYQDPDYEKIVMKDIPKNEIEAALVDSDIDDDESDDEDEESENDSSARVPDEESDFEIDEEDYEEDSDVEWIGTM